MEDPFREEGPCLAGDLVRVSLLLEGPDLVEATDPYLVADPVQVLLLHEDQGQAEEEAPFREVEGGPCPEVDPGASFART